MQNSQPTFVKPDQTIQPVQLITPAQAQPDSTAVSLPEGNSPIAIIMAISVLITSIPGLIKVLVPVMLQKPPKNK